MIVIHNGDLEVLAPHDFMCVYIAVVLSCRGTACGTLPWLCFWSSCTETVCSWPLCTAWWWRDRCCCLGPSLGTGWTKTLDSKVKVPLVYCSIVCIHSSSGIISSMSFVSNIQSYSNYRLYGFKLLICVCCQWPRRLCSSRTVQLSCVVSCWCWCSTLKNHSHTSITDGCWWVFD